MRLFNRASPQLIRGGIPAYPSWYERSKDTLCGVISYAFIESGLTTCSMQDA